MLEFNKTTSKTLNINFITQLCVNCKINNEYIFLTCFLPYNVAYHYFSIHLIVFLFIYFQFQILLTLKLLNWMMLIIYLHNI